MLMFSEDDSNAILLVDADNAFNRIKRKVMLHNIRIICPVFVTYVINSYRQEARLFMPGGMSDPTVLPIYTPGSLPLLNMKTTDSTKHAAYSDDISCLEKLKNILTWWNKLGTLVPKIGYFSKAKISWQIVKPGKYETVKGLFKYTKLNITNEGKSHLEAAVGTK